jgi:hypothetical protein
MALTYPEYLTKLRAAVQEIEAAEAALWDAARADGQGDARVPLVVREGSPLHDVVNRVLTARSEFSATLAQAPELS